MGESKSPGLLAGRDAMSQVEEGSLSDAGQLEEGPAAGIGRQELQGLGSSSIMSDEEEMGEEASEHWDPPPSASPLRCKQGKRLVEAPLPN